MNVLREDTKYAMGERMGCIAFASRESSTPGKRECVDKVGELVVQKVVSPSASWGSETPHTEENHEMKQDLVDVNNRGIDVQRGVLPSAT